MRSSDLSFLNPLSKNSGVKLSKYATVHRPVGADEIQDKTVIENCRLLYKDYEIVKNNRIKAGFSDYGFFTEIGFVYKALTGLHYGVYEGVPKDDNIGGIGGKGILDFLIFPLIARKLLWNSAIFISNKDNHQLSGTIHDLSKSARWIALIPSFVLALSLESLRLGLAAALAVLSVYAALFMTMAVLSVGIVTAPIWFPIYTIYNHCRSTKPPSVEQTDSGNKKVVVIMTDDPARLRMAGIYTVYKYDNLRASVSTRTPLSSITKPAKFGILAWRGFHVLDEKNPLSLYVEPFMFKPCKRESIKDYYLVELDVPRKHLESVIASMKKETYILKIDDELSEMGLYLRPQKRDADIDIMVPLFT